MDTEQPLTNDIVDFARVEWQLGCFLDIVTPLEIAERLMFFIIHQLNDPNLNGIVFLRSSDRSKVTQACVNCEKKHYFSVSQQLSSLMQKTVL